MTVYKDILRVCIVFTTFNVRVKSFIKLPIFFLSIIRKSIQNLRNKGFITYEKRTGYIPKFPKEEIEKIKDFIKEYESEVRSSDSIFSELVSFVKEKSEKFSSQLIQKVFRAYLLGDINELAEDEKEINKIIAVFILQKNSESP